MGVRKGRVCKGGCARERMCDGGEGGCKER